MKYQYTKIAPEHSNDPWIRRPVVDIVVHGPKRSLDLVALLDSGADHCLFHTPVVTVLGIDLESCKRGSIDGIDGHTHHTFMTEVELEVAYLPKVNISVMFWEHQSVSLLGQTGFFDLHRIKFERDHDVFKITPIKRAKLQENIPGRAH